MNIQGNTTLKEVQEAVDQWVKAYGVRYSAS